MKHIAIALLVTAGSAHAWTDPHTTSTSSSSSQASSLSQSTSESQASAAGGSASAIGGAGGSVGDSSFIAVGASPGHGSFSNAECTTSKYTHWGIAWNFFYLHTGSAEPQEWCIKARAQLVELQTAQPIRPQAVNYIDGYPAPKKAKPAVTKPRRVVLCPDGTPEKTVKVCRP